MSIEFKISEKERIIAIIATGDVDSEEIRAMRKKTIVLYQETDIENFLLDLSQVSSLVEQNTFTTYRLGKEFQDLEFPLSAKTAVILPADDQAREQVKFMHTVEVNRMRGPLEYFESRDQALAWFKSFPK